MRPSASVALAGLIALLPTTALASGVIDNVNGIALDATGKIVRFGAMLIDDDGKVAQLFPGRYQEPPRKKPKKGQSWPKGHDFKLDAGGKTMIPGLIDGHGQIMGLGLSFITLDLSDTRSLTEAQAKIRAYAQENGGRNWIVGRGWDEERWGLGRAPTAADLDAAVSDVPAWLERADSSAGWANSAALRAAGAANAARGRAGLFVGESMDAIRRVVPAPAPKDRDIALEKAQRALLTAGITAVTDMGTTIDDWQAYRRSADRGALRVRILAYAAGLPDMVTIAGPEPTPWLYDDRLRLGGVQLTLDGSLASRGAWLKAGYADAAGQRGRPLIPDTQLRNMMSRAAMDNFQIAIDASGDAAASEALDA
ncbi:MAG: amidohydrolase family protein, partial [Sphingobium sp.]